ncbi:MAG TPA: MFS transporter [Blastocatellia bacterium]|nr:MFS transporter [Blastocatellia bacterium]
MTDKGPEAGIVPTDSSSLSDAALIQNIEQESISPADETVEGELRWLNRNVVGMGVTSFLSDASHEVATAILPLFMAAINAPAAALGIIEGFADGISSFAKLGAGWLGDRIERRKPMIVGGYTLTAVGVGAIALATHWGFVLIARVMAWFGRGARSPLRDSIMAESVPPEAFGRAFGFERAGDSLGAVVGPALALALLSLIGQGSPTISTYHWIFLIAMLPGLLAALNFALLVKEKKRRAQAGLKFWSTVRKLPPSFKLFLVGVGLFGAGDFAHTLLTLRAVELLTPTHGAAHAGEIAIALYILHNVLYTAMSYPAGAIGDRVNKRSLLAIGYLIAAAMCAGFIIAIPSVWYLGLLFFLGGTYLAVEDTLERAIAADLLPAEVRATGFGVLATVNGVGDFLSSLVVGLLWTRIAPAAGFSYAAALSLLGAVVVFGLHKDKGRTA